MTLEERERLSVDIENGSVVRKGLLMCHMTFELDGVKQSLFITPYGLLKAINGGSESFIPEFIDEVD